MLGLFVILLTLQMGSICDAVRKQSVSVIAPQWFDATLEGPE